MKPEVTNQTNLSREHCAMDSRKIRLLVTGQSRNSNLAGWYVVLWIYSRPIASDCRQINSGAPNYLAFPQTVILKK